MMGLVLAQQVSHFLVVDLQVRHAHQKPMWMRSCIQDGSSGVAQWGYVIPRGEFRDCAPFYSAITPPFMNCRKFSVWCQLAPSLRPSPLANRPDNRIPWSNSTDSSWLKCAINEHILRFAQNGRKSAEFLRPKRTMIENREFWKNRLWFSYLVICYLQIRYNCSIEKLATNLPDVVLSLGDVAEYMGERVGNDAS